MTAPTPSVPKVAFINGNNGQDRSYLAEFLLGSALAICLQLCSGKNDR